MTSDPKPPPSDLENVHTAWGILPRWKARALALGEMQRVINDAASEAQQHPDQPHAADPERQAPPLVADAENGPPKTVIDAAMIEALTQAVDALASRLDQFENERKAAAALDALEEEIGREHPPEISSGGPMH